MKAKKIKKWKWIYVGLAILNLGVILSCLHLIYNVSGEFRHAVEDSYVIAEKIQKLSLLELKLVNIYSISNDIFVSESSEVEARKLERFILDFNQSYDQFYRALSEPDFENKTERTYGFLEKVKQGSLALEEKVSELISHFKKGEQSTEASKRLGEVNRIFYEVSIHFRKVATELRQIQLENLGKKTKGIRQVENLKTVLVFSSVLLTLGLILFGFVISKYINSSLEEKQVFDYQSLALKESAIVVMTDKNGVITFVNEQFEKISGYHKNELIGQTHKMVNSGYHSKEFFTDLWSVISRGRIWKGEIKNKRKDGTYYWVDSTIVPLKDDLGRVYSFVSIRFDVTQKKRIEAEVIEQQKQLDQFFDLSQDLLCIAEIDGYFKKVNYSLQDILGYRQEDLLTNSFLDFTHPDDMKKTISKLQELSSKSSGVTFTNRVEAKEGETIWVEWTATPTPDGNFYAIGRDVTEAQKIELELRKAKEAAEDAIKVKSMFFATMSHEIRTPMNGIIGMTNLMVENYSKDDELIEMLGVVQRCSNSLLDIINDILDFSKIEAGKMDVEHEPYSVEGTIREVLDLLSPKSAQDNVSMSYQIEAGTPKAVSGDVTKFRQVLVNLVGNAIKFSKGGRVNIYCKGSNLVDDRWELEVCVRDNGIGIPDHVKDRLFKPFSQVDASTTRQFGGTGLGLAICKGLCEVMGGTIWVESNPGLGASFYFTLKVKEDKSFVEQVGALNPFEGTDKDMGSRFPLRILVVEDNRTNQVVVTGMLGKLGYHADIAGNGLEALEVLANKKYDLILMDCHMPLMDGFEATEKIVSKYGEESPTIYAITASTMKEDIDKCIKCGMKGVLGKPLLLPSLLKVLNETLGASRGSDIIGEGEMSKDDTNESSQVAFDKKQFLEQFEGMEEIALKVIEKFNEGLPELLQQIEKSIQDKNAPELERAAHTLKGAAANLFATASKELCFELEKMGREGNLDLAETKLHNLKERLQELDGELTQLNINTGAA